jgi:hypothetical protein
MVISQRNTYYFSTEGKKAYHNSDEMLTYTRPYNRVFTICGFFSSHRFKRDLEITLIVDAGGL